MHASKFTKFKFIVRDARVFPGIWFDFIYPIIQAYSLLSSETGGHFACGCVHPLNDNNVGASNLMAGNRKPSCKVTVLLKAISLVL